jgi:hypothetical protein
MKYESYLLLVFKTRGAHNYQKSGSFFARGILQDRSSESGIFGFYYTLGIGIFEFLYLKTGIFETGIFGYLQKVVNFP